MSLPNDEIQILRRALASRDRGLDYNESSAWERPLVDRLVDAGLLAYSIVGLMIGSRAYALTDLGAEVAGDCRDVIDHGRFDIRDRVMARIRSLETPFGSAA